VEQHPAVPSDQSFVISNRIGNANLSASFFSIPAPNGFPQTPL
jgi:hypothetical protein